MTYCVDIYCRLSLRDGYAYGKMLIAFLQRTSRGWRTTQREGSSPTSRCTSRVQARWRGDGWWSQTGCGSTLLILQATLVALCHLQTSSFGVASLSGGLLGYGDTRWSAPVVKNAWVEERMFTSTSLATTPRFDISVIGWVSAQRSIFCNINFHGNTFKVQITMCCCYYRFVTSATRPIGTPCWRRSFAVDHALKRAGKVKVARWVVGWHGIMLSSANSARLTKPCSQPFSHLGKNTEK